MYDLVSLLREFLRIDNHQKMVAYNLPTFRQSNVLSG
jgi:hypothetical protein